MFEGGTTTTPSTGFHVMAKPTGAICNLDCEYCFYLDKESLYRPGSRFRMPEDVLEAFVRQQFSDQRGESVVFSWQGGEPTLMGVEFFEKAVALQRRWGDGRPVENTLQTNGVKLDDEWGAFFARERFLVGVSIDGPRELHDCYRLDKGGKPTFERVLRGIEVLRKHGVEFNTITVLHDRNVRHPLEIYRFLKEAGSGYMQFIPLVERVAGPVSRQKGWTHAPPPRGGVTAEEEVTPWSVRPEDFGAFLVEVFDEWVRKDVGKVFVQLFDVALGVWMGHPAGLCLFKETCGEAVALEHNGDVFSCDHFVYPEDKLGNLLDESLGSLVGGVKQREFGAAKRDSLPRYCRECEVRFVCNGECPKNRFVRTPDGEPGLNYLCSAYKRFFLHIDPAMRGMAWLARRMRPPAEIMELGIPPRQPGPPPGWQPAGTNPALQSS